ncbi:MAG: zinc-dependent metalloprotease, partial [Bdellovibrionota bacterium]
MTMQKFVLFFIFAGSVALTGCSKDKAQVSYQPLVVAMKQEAAKETPKLMSLQTLQPNSRQAIVTEVTLRRSALFNRTFLYGTSLQFSAVKEDDINVTLAGMNIGQVPAEFQIVDDKLRLVSDARLNFESDVNHPSHLIHEFPILKQDADTITIRAEHASPLLDTLLTGSKNLVEVRESFIRSLEFAEKDQLFLIESTLELKDGALAEFMETIVPRDLQVPSDYKPIYNDADLEPNADRFRFLDSGQVFIDKDGKRIPTKLADRFVRKNGEPIRWYVTRNVDQKYLVDIKNAVEAWNRYSRAMGISDLVRFEGLVPEGVKVGDPRYNLIVWDTVQDAGAAYESQNADPLSGVQSHSMLYIPYAWVNIAKTYWESAGHSAKDEAKAAAVAKILKDRKFMGRDLPINCMDDAEMHVTETSKQSPELFARSLLKGVIFHEVGHSFGLGHNFKGSLSFDPDDSKKLFSTSIMDYNHYNEEEAAFYNVETSDGPLLEYDRQIISLLYNDGKDIKESDAKLPACADDEADSFKDGVDPLCVRYDIGSDPTKQALRSLDLITKEDAHSGMMRSLALALKSTVSDLGNPADVKTLDDAKAAIKKLGTVVKGTANIYISGSANSFAYLGSQAVKSLYVFKDDILPEGYDADEMRDRALSVLEAATNANAFPAVDKQALETVKEGAKAFLAQTQAISGLSDADKTKAVTDLMAALDKSFAATEVAVLSKARTRILTAAAYQAEAPLSFLKRGGAAVDGEASVLAILERLTSAKAGALDRPAAERLAAIKNL